MAGLKFRNWILGAPVGLFLAGWPLIAQTAPIDADLFSRGPSWGPDFRKLYKPLPFPALNTQNGPLLEGSIHDAKLQLSLSDFLRLVVENGLDLESGRYVYLIAQNDLLRARSGQAARGLPQAPLPEALFAGAIGASVGNQAGLSQLGTGAAAITGAARQFVLQPRGNFDPVFLLNASYDHLENPLNTERVSGVPTATIPSTALQTRYQQQFPLGTSYSVSFNMQTQGTTQKFLLYNPAYTSFFSIAIVQPLLNGFGVALNRRFITFAENERRISREFFSSSLNNSLANAANLYWDYVALQEQVRVARQAVAVSEALYRDDQRAFTVGILARLDVVQAESQLATDRRNLVTAETNLQLQEVRLKSVISKTIGPELADAHIEATDPLPGPNEIRVPPLEEAIAAATRNRASVRQAQIGIENQRLAEMFTRNNLLPTFNLFAQFNSFALTSGTTAMFRQLAQWDYPEWAVGFSLTVPIRNRATQADSTRARLETRQAETSLRRLQRQIELAVRTAALSVTQYNAQVEAAARLVEASEQALKGEQLRLTNGLSIPYRVILAQRDLVTAQSAQTQAQVNYAKSRIAFELATGTIQPENGISFDDAFRGALWTSSRKP